MTLHDDILAEADKIIAGDRRVDYGDVTDSFVALASLWTWYLKTKFKVDFELTGIDVAMIMTLMKVSRGTTGAAKRDNLVDICGYAALGARFLAVGKVKSNREKVEDLILKAVDQAKEEGGYSKGGRPIEPFSYEGFPGKKPYSTPLPQHSIVFVPMNSTKMDLRNLDAFTAYANKEDTEGKGEVVCRMRYRPMGEEEPTGGTRFPYKEAWGFAEEGELIFYHDKASAVRHYEEARQLGRPVIYPLRVMYEVLP